MRLIAVIAIALTVAALVRISDACGGVTHNTIGRRALSYFSNQEYAAYAKQYPSAFQNGCVFPDWGYSLGGGLADASEAAHWPPFIKAVANYIHSNLTRPWTQPTEMLVAFMMGVMSHSAADISWHDLATVYDLTHQGLIQSMANLEFEGNFSQSHSEADTGGEMVIASQSRLTWLQDAWYVPILTMAQLYRSLGYTAVTEGYLAEGNLLLFVAAQAVVEAGPYIDPVVEFQAPFLQENIFNFFIGGIDDMSYWTQQCWNYLIEWIETGSSSRDCLIEPTNQKTTRDGNSKRRYSPSMGVLPHMLADAKWLARMHEVRGRVLLERTKEGIFYRIKPKPEVQPQISKSQASTQALECHTNTDQQTRVTQITVQSNFSYLGSALAHGDFNADGIMDIAIGAPGETTANGNWQSGAVFILYGPIDPFQQIDLTTINPSDVIYNNEVYSRFGEQLAVIDWNRDQIADLAIAAPRVNAAELSYTGEVHIYLGSKPNGISTNRPFTVITTTTSNASVGNFAMLGSTLLGADVNGDGCNDLVLGSPFACSLTDNCNNGLGPAQRGVVTIFVSGNHLTPVVVASSADWIAYGENSFDWFGSSLDLTRTSQGRVLLVGAESAKNSVGTQQAGKVYAYLIKGTIGALMWKIEGVGEFTKLGTSVAHGNPYGYTIPGEPTAYFLVSAPTSSNILPPFDLTYYRAGSVATVPFNQMKTGKNYTLPQVLSFSSLLESDELFAHLGQSMTIGDVNGDEVDDVIISEPLSSREAGRVFVWFGGIAFPSGGRAITSETASWCYTSSPSDLSSTFMQPRLGWTVDVADANHDGFLDLLLASPRQSSNANTEDSGRVSIVYGPLGH